MTVESVVMFKSLEGVLYCTEKEAKQANGRTALTTRLREEFGSEPMFTLHDVLKNLDDWYICKLEGSK